MPILTKFLTYIYKKGKPGSGIAASAIEGGGNNGTIPDNALPANVMRGSTSGLTHEDAGSVANWRQASTDSSGTIDFSEIVGPDGAPATYDPTAGTIKVPGQFTDAEVAEGKELFKDIRARGFENIATARISAVNGRGNVAYTLAQARAYASWRANGGAASSVGTAQENRNFIIETQTRFELDNPKFRVALIEDDAAPIIGTLTYLGSNAAGTRFYYNAHFARLPAGGDILLSVQYDLPTELEDVAIPAANIDGVISQANLPKHIGNTVLHEGAAIGASYLGQDLYGSLNLYTPNFDLDAAENQHGRAVIESIIALDQSSLSDSTLRFGTNAELTHTFNADISAVTLRSSMAYAANATNGVRVGSIGVYRNGNILVATITEYEAKDAAGNLLGYFWHIDQVESGYSFTFTHTLNAYFPRDSGSVAAELLNQKAAVVIDNQVNVDLPSARTFIGRVSITPNSRDKRVLITLLGGQLTWTASADARIAIYHMPNASATVVAGATLIADTYYNYRGTGPISQAALHAPANTTEQVYAVFVSRSAAGVRLNAVAASPLILTAEEV